MSDLKRFKVCVAADGTVTITGPDRQPITAQPARLASIPDFLARDQANDKSKLVPPALKEQPGYRQEDDFLCLLCENDGQIGQIWEPYAKIYKKESYDDGDLKAMGRFLFDKLVGGAAWKEMQEIAGAGAHIELALLFDGNLQQMHRFNWELMYDGREFLATRRAAITRLVGREVHAAPRLFVRPPKVLFVISVNYADKEIRPGAEYFALMRQLEADRLTVHSRVVQMASPGQIRAAVKSFGKSGPDMVHFICHGDVDQDGEKRLRGCLVLQEENKSGTIRRFGDQILADLSAGGGLPPIVILSACHSGTQPVSGAAQSSAQPFLGAAQMGSLAAELVAGGVPCVVGMGGSVSDAACRLFTRRFGEAVIAGESLVAATAEGRWAAYIDRTPQTIDWAFPTLFMADDVEPGYNPVCVNAGQDPSTDLMRRYDAYGIPRHPVFCARLKFQDRFDSLFSESGPHVLAIYTRSDTQGIGRTRLLQELAAQALREGHVPILVSHKLNRWAPHFPNVTQLVVEILSALGVARDSFGLAPLIDTPLMKSLVKARPPDDLEELRLYHGADPGELCKLILIRFLPGQVDKVTGTQKPGIDDVWSAEELRTRLSYELESLMDEARVKADAVGPTSRAVVLLDQVHEYDQALAPLLDTLIDNDGLGKKGKPVPVVLCYSKRTPADKTLEEASENNSIHWLLEELEEFQEGEDLLAYEQVMLNPDPESVPARDVAAELHVIRPDEVASPVVAFAYNSRADKEKVEKWITLFRSKLGKSPVIFTQDKLHNTFLAACYDGFLVTADDELRLRKLREVQ
jgi:hypothetical protein